MTRYFKIDTMPKDTAFAFTDDEPSGFSKGYKLSSGDRVLDKDSYPADAAVRMSDAFGRDLGGIIGNTQSLLIVSKALKDEIEQVNADPVQILRVAILNHKKRIASGDYFVVNPIGHRDCLDLDASEIEFHDGDVVSVDKIVLSEEKLVGAPDLFRVKEDPSVYVASEHLVRRWIKSTPRPKNVYLIELTVTPAEPAQASKPRTTPKKR
jgi:hypothetical protein